jgi:hypothetical protein
MGFTEELIRGAISLRAIISIICSLILLACIGFCL